MGAGMGEHLGARRRDGVVAECAEPVRLEVSHDDRGGVRLAVGGPPARECCDDRPHVHPHAVATRVGDHVAQDRCRILDAAHRGELRDPGAGGVNAHAGLVLPGEDDGLAAALEATSQVTGEAVVQAQVREHVGSQGGVATVGDERFGSGRPRGGDKRVDAHALGGQDRRRDGVTEPPEPAAFVAAQDGRVDRSGLSSAGACRGQAEPAAERVGSRRVARYGESRLGEALRIVDMAEEPIEQGGGAERRRPRARKCRGLDGQRRHLDRPTTVQTARRKHPRCRPADLDPARLARTR